MSKRDRSTPDDHAKVEAVDIEEVDIEEVDIEQVDTEQVDTEQVDTEQVDESDDDGDETNALLSRLRVIEDQPLEARAAAFAQINDELQARLEGGDSARSYA